MNLEVMIFAVISLIFLIPIFYFLPLGIEFRGKLLIVGAAALSAAAGLAAGTVLASWQAVLVSILLLLLFMLLFQKKSGLLAFEAFEEEEEPFHYAKAGSGFTDYTDAKEELPAPRKNDSAGENRLVNFVDGDLSEWVPQPEDGQAAGDDSLGKEKENEPEWEEIQAEELNEAEWETDHDPLDSVLSERINEEPEEQAVQEEKPEKKMEEIVPDWDELFVAEGLDPVPAEAEPEEEANNDGSPADAVHLEEDEISPLFFEDEWNSEEEFEREAEIGEELEKLPVFESSENSNAESEQEEAAAEGQEHPQDLEQEAVLKEGAAGIQAEEAVSTSDISEEKGPELEGLEDFTGEEQDWTYEPEGLQEEQPGDIQVNEEKFELEELDDFTAEEQEQRQKAVNMRKAKQGLIHDLEEVKEEQAGHSPVEDADSGQENSEDSPLDLEEKAQELDKEQELASNEPAAKEMLQERTSLHQEIFQTLLDQLVIAKSRLDEQGYERLLVTCLEESLPMQDYYTIASLLIQHYLEAKEYGPLKTLLDELEEKFADYPIVCAEVRYMKERFCRG